MTLLHNKKLDFNNYLVLFLLFSLPRGYNLFVKVNEIRPMFI